MPRSENASGKRTLIRLWHAICAMSRGELDDGWTKGKCQAMNFERFKRVWRTKLVRVARRSLGPMYSAVAAGGKPGAAAVHTAGRMASPRGNTAGRLVAAGMDRAEFLRSLIDTRGTGLEIGPGYNPLLPKSAGFLVETVDYTDKESLVKKYQGAANVDTSRIEEVDHVVNGVSLAEAIQRRGHYDYIVASHVIEHQPDMLGFLQDCDALLKPAGVLLLAVPDKRYCFDVLQPLSSTGQVIQSHLDRRTRPGFGSIFDDRAYNATRGGSIGWGFDESQEICFYLPPEQAIAALQQDRISQAYIDVHVWKFVPSSFRLLVSDLTLFGYLALRESAFYDGIAAHEFYITLSRDGEGCPVDRMTLARRALAEHAAITAAPP